MNDLQKLETLELEKDKVKFLNAIKPDALAKKLDKLEVLTDLTADYLELADGEVIRAVYMGQTTFRTEDEAGDEVRKPAIKLRAATGTFISAGTVLVNSCVDLPRFAPIEITNQGMEGKGTRKYINYKVRLLDAS